MIQPDMIYVNNIIPHAQTLCPLCIISLHNYFRININNNNTILSTEVNLRVDRKLFPMGEKEVILGLEVRPLSLNFIDDHHLQYRIVNFNC